MILDIPLLKHQIEFCEDITTPNLALVGGYGCGKTYSFCIKGLSLAALNVGYEGALLEPTHGMVMRVLYKSLKDILIALQIPFTAVKSPTPRFDILFEGGVSTIHLLGSENYERLAGMNLAWFGVDEFDLIKPDVAMDAWMMLQSRVRTGNVSQRFAVSTPEGYKFMYKYFVEQMLDEDGNVVCTDRKIIHASTYDNPFLPAHYIPSLLSTLPPDKAEAYLNGQFVNITSNPVYYTFDRTLNNTDRTVDDFKPNSVLHIGQDFNIGQCSSIVHIVENDIPYAIDEIVGAQNTEAVIKEIKARYPNRVVYMYPDPAGKNGSTSSASSDHAQLRNAGFMVKARAAHPAIKDRVSAMNARICNANGERRYFINTKKCKSYTKSLEQQAYNDKGDPDKSTGLDHPLDAGGYFIEYTWPIQNKKGTIRTY